MTDFADDEIRPLAEELDYIRHLALDLRGILKQSKESLKGTGFRLPPGTTTTLSDIARRSEAVASRVAITEHERDQYRAVTGVAALINSSLDLTQVLNEVMDTIIQLTGAERGYLMLRNSDTGEMEFRIARNVERESLDSAEFEISRSIVNRVAESGEAVITTNAQEDSRFQGAESIVSYSLRSILCVPLTLRDEITGVIYTDNKIHAGLFTEATRDLLMLFASMAAVAIENARLFQRLRSTLDAITEMKNLQDNVFASIASGVITTDDYENVTLMNRRAHQILGLEEAQFTGARLREVLPPLGPRFDTIIEQTVGAEQPLTGIEFDADLDTRGAVNLSMNFSPLRDAYAQTQGVAIVLDDLTEIKRREAQIAGVRRYLPIEVVDGIQSADELKLGGTIENITILFADIRGFSTFSEYLAPEHLVDIINTYMTIASDAIHAQQGVIDKFMGDAVMALYNTPLRPQADHAMRAVRSSLAMMDDIRAYNETVSGEELLQFGIGLHTGEALVGNVGSPERLDYTAMGDSVNLSKRLQEVAAPMQILLSDDTFQFVADMVEVVELEPILVKGRQQEVKVYELVRVL